MNNKEFINNLISKKENKHPKYLYKYRPFDKFSIDMLENNYLFLCRAKDLDDETECDVSFDVSNYINLERNEISIKLIEIFNEYLIDLSNNKSLIDELHFEKQWINYKELKKTIKSIKEFEDNPEYQDAIDNVFESIQEWFETKDSDILKPVVQVGLEAKNRVGVCSLSENYNDDEMWNYYANLSTGYCIEFDCDDYLHVHNLIPVNYVEENKRETNLIIQLSKSLLGSFIENMSESKLQTDKSAYISLFCTKYKKWSYQNEWRILGEANSKISAPNISRIIIGKKASKETEKIITDFCKSHNIKIEKII